MDTFHTYIFGEISQELQLAFMNEVGSLLLDGCEELTIYLNSEGGCIYTSFAIYDYISNLPVKTTVVGIGQVLSSANVIMAAGDIRLASENTFFMLHEVYSSMAEPGNLSIKYFKNEGRHLADLNNRMAELIAKKSGNSLKKIARDLKGQDYYLNAKGALNYGLIDNLWFNEGDT